MLILERQCQFLKLIVFFTQNLKLIVDACDSWFFTIDSWLKHKRWSIWLYLLLFRKHESINNSKEKGVHNAICWKLSPLSNGTKLSVIDFIHEWVIWFRVETIRKAMEHSNQFYMWGINRQGSDFVVFLLFDLSQ